jgi:hypothetical protein
VWLETRPAGARVTGPGSRALGITPCELERPAAATELVFERRGYRRLSHTLAPDGPDEVSLALEPLPRPNRPAPRDDGAAGYEPVKDLLDY